jgi:hypothetical protein
MNVEGFDAAVAKAHGYKIVTYANGDQQSVPIDPHSHLPKSLILHHAHGLRIAANSDYDRIVGNCGTSWIAVLQTGASAVQVASGFVVTPAPAVDYGWTVSITDANGTTQKESSGALFFKSAWARAWTNIHQHLWTFDYVESGFAILDDGTICFSGTPAVSLSGLA